MDTEEAQTIGRRLRQIRKARGKSLRVLAGLSGINRMTLSRIETGQRALDSRSEIAALVDALEIAPSELTTRQSVPLPAPDKGDGARGEGARGEGTAVKAVRRALIAVSRDEPAGQVVPVDVLRARVAALTTAQRQCAYKQVGSELPGLIRDVHTTMAAGKEVEEVLALVVMLHVQGTHAFLHDAGAHPDLCWQVAVLARQAAQHHGGADLRGLAAFGAANGLLAAGEFDTAQAELDSVTVPTTTVEAEQLDGMLALSRSLIAAADRRVGDVDAPLDHALDLAARIGHGSAYGLDFGPTNARVWQMAVALEAHNYPQAARIAETIRPELLISATRKAAYWADYGRALARLRGRHDDAVQALRHAELISPTRVHRHPFSRDVLAELLPRVRRDSSTGRTLRRMAYRAGLPV